MSWASEYQSNALVAEAVTELARVLESDGHSFGAGVAHCRVLVKARETVDEFGFPRKKPPPKVDHTPITNARLDGIEDLRPIHEKQREAFNLQGKTKSEREKIIKRRILEQARAVR